MLRCGGARSWKLPTFDMLERRPDRFCHDTDVEAVRVIERQAPKERRIHDREAGVFAPMPRASAVDDCRRITTDP